MASSPYGGNRNGGRKPAKKRGGQPGNVNRRASDFLPPAKDTDERRAFLDALTKAEGVDGSERVEVLGQLAFARVMSLAEKVGLAKVVSALRVLDRVRLSDLKANGLWNAGQREQLLNAALGDIWSGVKECENCAGCVDQILAGLQLQLVQRGQDGMDAENGDRGTGNEAQS